MIKTIHKCTVSGVAVLPDGSRMPYKEYIGNGCPAHPHWEKARNYRYIFDGCRCVICHAELDEKSFQTHHLTYERLGHERVRDVITLCNDCHENFHSVWKYAEYYKEQDDDHWEMFSLDDTAKLCGTHLQDDFWFGGELNCCSMDTCRNLIDEYYRENDVTVPVVINPEDVQLYFRNKRYEVLFEAEQNGMTLNGSVDASVDVFLDARFGAKGGKGGNPKRSEARTFTTRHGSESFHRNYWYLWHINILLQEAKKYE